MTAYAAFIARAARVDHQPRPKSMLGLAIGKPCPYCDKPMQLPDRRPTRDHLLARPHRDRLPPEIRVKLVGIAKIIVCRPCNGAKGSHTLGSWLVVLAGRRDPRAAHVRRVIDRLRARTDPATGYLLCYGRLP